MYRLLNMKYIDIQENRLLPTVGPCGQEVDVGTILSLVDISRTFQYLIGRREKAVPQKWRKKETNE